MFLKRYSVYSKKSGLPVMINGTAEQCAAAMGVTIGSFYSTYSRLTSGRATSGTWEIFQDDDLEDDCDER